jgi:hypothetical protein
MVNVVAADHNPLEVPLVIDDPVNENAHADECDQETAGSDKHTAAGAIWDRSPDQIAQAGELEQNEQDNDHQTGKRHQHRGTKSGHIPY